VLRSPDSRGESRFDRDTVSEERNPAIEILRGPVRDYPQETESHRGSEALDPAEAVLYLLHDMGRPDGSPMVKPGVLDRAREIVGAMALIEFDRAESDGGAVVLSFSGVIPADVDLSALGVEAESRPEARVFVSGRALVARGRGRFLAALFESARECEEWEKSLIVYLSERLTRRQAGVGQPPPPAPTDRS